MHIGILKNIASEKSGKIYFPIYYRQKKSRHFHQIEILFYLGTISNLKGLTIPFPLQNHSAI
jgi:hypothetical protein